MTLDQLKDELGARAQQSLGTPVVVNGISFGSDADDRAKFDALRALISGGAINGNVTLKDAGGGFHSMSASDAATALLSYGAAYYERWVAVETAKAGINAATDEETARAAFAAFSPAP